MESSYPHIGFLTYAKQFLKAATVIVECGQIQRTHIAVTYLYGHAIELALKSILVKNGVPLDKLRKEIRHDLEKALDELELYSDKSFVDKELRVLVHLLNPEYGKEHLEYHPGIRVMSLPSETEMQETVGNLITKLNKHYRTRLSAEH